MQDQNDQEQAVEQKNPAGCLKILGTIIVGIIGIIAVGAIVFYIAFYIVCGGSVGWKGG
jgi:hypothetical protein